MKLQHLAVIFIIIMLPISLIISGYTQIQIDALNLQQQYDANLKKATYDAVKAFDMNTAEDNVANVADSLRDDILASISTFVKSFSSNLGVSGYNIEVLKPYMPAILFTLYDGYYIYAPTRANGVYEYMLQPYNYYSVRYNDGTGQNDIVINYTLDNYIVVYGWINGIYMVNSGYLVNKIYDRVVEEETIEANVPVAKLDGTIIKDVRIERKQLTSPEYSRTNVTLNKTEYLFERNELYYIDPKSAKLYNNEVRVFRNWVDEYLQWVRPCYAMRTNDYLEEFSGDMTQIFKIDSTNDPEIEDSPFNEHRVRIIQNTIEHNLNYVITAYAQSAVGEEVGNYNFRLPKMNSDEWFMIASNVCMVPFVQGMPVGTKFYNNYTIVKSSTNRFFAEPENIYFVNGNGEYHRIDCPELDKGSGNIQGFSSFAFDKFHVRISADDSEEKYLDYWKHDETACYYCIVSSNYKSTFNRNSEGYIIDDIDQIQGTRAEDKKKAYYTAVARERYNQYKTTNYLREAEQANLAEP